MNKIVPIGLFVAILIVWPLASQQPVPAKTVPMITPAKSEQSKPEVAPTIPDKDLKDFFKAQLAVTNAQNAMGAAQQQMKQVIGKLTDDCGEKASPIIDQGTQEPICQLKPPEPTKPEKK
jgi:hypothetical protein